MSSPRRFKSIFPALLLCSVSWPPCSKHCLVGVPTPSKPPTAMFMSPPSASLSMSAMLTRLLPAGGK